MTDTDTALIASLSGFTPGPWAFDPKNGYWLGGFSNGKTRICEFGVGHGIHPNEGDPPNHSDAALIAAAPDLHRIATEQAAEIERLRGALSAVFQYGSDTLLGPTDSADDTRYWQRQGVAEMTSRASAVLKGFEA